MAVVAALRVVEIRLGRKDACTVACDVALVGQVVSNLMENAIRHSGARVVEVSVEARDHGGAIVVEDHGVGIPEAERERVFERFHRVDPSRTAETGGAGLGLAIVRRIARLHGGDIVLEPAVPSGCRFIVKIPDTLRARRVSHAKSEKGAKVLR